MFLFGGKMLLQTADDGAHSDHSLTVGESAGDVYDNVQIIVTKGYEGLEAQHITQNSGAVITHTTDDGFNAGGGNDGSGNQGGFNPWGGGGPGGGGFGGSGNADDYTLTFNGGFALVDVENSGDHDGLDSNGHLTVAGGIVVTNGNQPFDYGNERGGKLSCTGGIWIEDSRCRSYMETQPNYSVTGGTVNQGERITLVGSDGKVIVSFIAGKAVTTLRAGGNVTGVTCIDILSVIRMHLENSSHSLIDVFCRIIDGIAGVYGAGIYSEEAELADKLVGCYFECESRKRLFV